MKSSERSYWTFSILAILVLLAVPTYGQFRNGKIIDERSGLSDVRVRVMAKDRYGFMWIGTRRGLNRFDGSQVQQFLHDPEDSLSLLNSEVSAMVIDSHGLWVGGTLGISSVDFRDFSIRNVRFDCDSVITGPAGPHIRTPQVSYLYLQDSVLWISTRNCGLIRFEPITGNFRRFSFTGHRDEVPEMVSSEALDMILGFAADPVHDSIFWIGTEAGLIRFNHRSLTHTLFYYRHSDLLFQDAINMFRRVFVHADGRVFYNTWGWGINVYDPGSRTFYPLLPAGITDKHLRHHVVSIHPHDDYSIWIRTVDGLHLFNTGLNRITAYYPNENATASYFGLDYLDEAGRRWVPTSEGIYVYDPLHEQFLVFSYEHLNEPEWPGFARKVFQHPDGNVVTILGQSVDALYHFSHRTNTWFETPIPGFPTHDGYGFNGIDFTIGERGWMFSGLDGVYAFDPKAYQVHKVNLNITLARSQYLDLEWGHDNSLWIGTRHEGLLRYDPGTQTTKQYLTEVYGEGVIDTRPYASFIHCDSKGQIWFVTGYGHSVYLPSADIFHNFRLTDPEIHTAFALASFAEDAHGNIWAVTRHGVLLKGNADAPEAGLTVQTSLFDHGITPSYVEGIVYGEDQRLHVLCENALIQIDTNLDISHFSFDYAAYIGDFYCFDNLFESSLVVGLSNSFAVLNSNGLKRNTELARPYLTGITINEKPMSGNFTSIKPHLSLKHNENFISFSFSAISYTLPENNQYRYRLTSFDPDWIEAGERRFANYTNVPSGTYAFELQVANNEGIWNPETYTVPVVIARPWWSTWLFRIAALLCLVTGGVLAYRYRIRQIRKEAEVKAEFERKIGDVELSALKAQMNPHFIFNCLNSIENYILKNESMKAAEYINDFARLIRLILQNSRSQYIPLKDEVEALDLYLQMESLRFDNKFEYHIDIAPEVELAETDIPPMLIQPFVENAIWHGLIPKNAPGRLAISIARNNGELHCVIEDNGIGREKSREVNASMHKRGKKSMGMLITKNRIDVINELYQTNATVHIHDLKDPDGKSLGTRVELNIPVE